MYISGDICLLSHCCSSQLREKIVCLHNRSNSVYRYRPGTDFTVPINNYILWSVIK